MEVPDRQPISVSSGHVDQLVRVLGLSPQEAVDTAIKGYLKIVTWLHAAEQPEPHIPV